MILPKPSEAMCLSVIWFLFTSLSGFCQTEPIALHPQNPHYFIYKNKPAILVTSGEHYGAVLNTAFDFTSYLDELASSGLNLTRTFSGAYMEPQGAFNIASNTLAPAPGKLLCPWARSDSAGYRNGGNRFNLNRWDECYFARLRKFIGEAAVRDIIVELTFFCPFYEDPQWLLSPMNGANNINNVGNVARTDVYTMDKSGGLLGIQENMVRKFVSELQEFDNLVYEICNEPYFGGVTLEWQHHIAEIISDAEKGHSKKHLITQNIANFADTIRDPHPAVSVYNFHYASPPVTVSLNYHLDKPIGDNETGFRGTSDSTYRMEGWRFILAGGALYNNLDYSFTVGHEKGDFQYPAEQPGGGTRALRRQLSYLKSFISRFDFTGMKPDSNRIENGSIANAAVQVLSEPGRQYAFYIFGGRPSRLGLLLPDAEYEAEWMHPLTGKYEKKLLVTSVNGKASIDVPAYREDIALRIVRRKNVKHGM